MISSNQLPGLKVLGLAGAIVAMAGMANAAGVVTGSLWEGDSSGDASMIPPGSPNATFTSPLINFASGGLYTIGEFLSSAGSTILTGFGELGNTMDNTHIELKGSVFLSAGANNFDITHDDGVVVSVATIGTVLSVPLPTSPVTTPFTVNAPSAGAYSFTVEYNECCGAPAVLSLDTPNGAPVNFVPDAGATFALLGLSVAGLAAMRKHQ
jgi:hypothetical protein